MREKTAGVLHQIDKYSLTLLGFILKTRGSCSNEGDGPQVKTLLKPEILYGGQRIIS